MKREEKIKLLFDTYKNLIFHVANEILKDKGLAEDAVQETFLRAFDNLEKINEISCHKTRLFLVTICKRVAIDIYNNRKRFNIIPLENLDHKLESNLTYEDETGEYKAIVETIKSLPYIYSEVILLKYVNDLSNLEISEVLNIKEATIRKRLERGRKMLKESLEEKGWDLK